MIVDDWTGCYNEGWNGLIVPGAFSHPAKFSRALIQRIYQHVMAEGWARAGDIVVDPFAGVALGALDAQFNGLEWVGVELEQKFVDLAQQNLDLWQRRYGNLARWGRARILQGDSRNLATLVRGAGLSYSSPPYAETFHGQTDGKDREQREREAGSKLGGGQINHPRDYGSSAGQLGAMRAGDAPTLSVSSPPYAETAVEKNSAGIDRAKQYQTYRAQGGGMGYATFCEQQERHSQGYGSSPGQLAALKAGDAPNVSISSPPFGEGETRDRYPVQPGYIADCITRGYTQDKQGNTPGNLASLVCSSPPYEGAHIESDMQRRAQSGKTPIRDIRKNGADKYSDAADNMGNQQGETFWAAARTIVGQLYAVLCPGAHAIWVTKRFVRNKEIVDFSLQWATLCESCGFQLVHWHRAWVTEEHGEQLGLMGESVTKRTERKSFFRRLAESKGSPRIDWEDVLCMVRL